MKNENFSKKHLIKSELLEFLNEIKKKKKMNIKELTNEQSKWHKQVKRKKHLTIFIECGLRDRLAEIVNQYLQKGDKISLIGELCHSVWQDESTGQMRSKYYIKVNELDLPARKSERK